MDQTNVKQPPPGDMEEEIPLRRQNIRDEDIEHFVEGQAKNEDQFPAPQQQQYSFRQVKQLELVEVEGEWQPQACAQCQNKAVYTQSGTSDTSVFTQSEPVDIFKVLLPKKVVNGICTQLNNKLKDMLKDQVQDERNLKKKFFKADQMYEYFGVKILMGYCRMPDPEDYFNPNLPFRNRIGELIKEGRFKCVATMAEMTDEMFPTKEKKKSSFEPYDVELLIPKVMKKINKVQKRVNAPGSMLSIMRDQYFELTDSGQQFTAVYLQDANTEFIQQMSFQSLRTQPQGILRMLETYKHKNHKVYVEKNLMTLNMIHHLAVRSGVYCHAVVKNSAEVKFNKAELMVNGPLTLYLIKQKDPTQVFVSTADGFQKAGLNDPRPFAPQMMQDNLKRAETFQAQTDQYKSLFQGTSNAGILMTQVLEMITWNSYIVYKTILQKNPGIEYLDFRILLAKQFLTGKMKLLEQQPMPKLPLFHPQMQSTSVQTEKLSSFSSFNQKIAISLFHIPTQLSDILLKTMVPKCIVCRKNLQLTQCSNCSEVSGKVVILCPSECFRLFHNNTKEYISAAEDIPSMGNVIH